MSFVGLSLMSSRSAAIFRSKSIFSQIRTLQVSCRCLEYDNSNKSSDAKDKLAQLLQDIKNAKAKKDENEAPKVTLTAKPKKRIHPEEAQETKKGDKNLKKKLKIKKDDPVKTNTEVFVEPELVRAAYNVAGERSRLEPNEDLQHFVMKKTESDLLMKLKSIAVETSEAKEASEVAGASKTDLQTLFGGMKIAGKHKLDQKSDERKYASVTSSRRSFTEEEKAFLERRKRLRRDQKEDEETLSVFKSLLGAEEALGIFGADFKESPSKSSAILNQTFEKCCQRELQIMSTPSPRNFLETMIRWTDNGVLWHFPINNEQGIEEKDMEPFYKHIFLEPHLEPWCPQRGPVRHFMEVICVGLSKNPYISVDKKIEHINWFRDYFEKDDHKEILKLTGAIEA